MRRSEQVVPDERSDIRNHSNTASDFAAFTELQSSSVTVIK
jgi:hypothetical protein